MPLPAPMFFSVARSSASTLRCSDPPQRREPADEEGAQRRRRGRRGRRPRPPGLRLPAAEWAAERSDRGAARPAGQLRWWQPGGVGRRAAGLAGARRPRLLPAGVSVPSAAAQCRGMSKCLIQLVAMSHSADLIVQTYLISCWIEAQFTGLKVGARTCEASFLSLILALPEILGTL